MPKYSREMEEKIIALFEQGKRNSVISRELGIYRGALPSRRKEWEKQKQKQEKPETEKEAIIHQEQPLDPQKYTPAHIEGGAISENAIIKLNQLHALFGTNSMEEMLDTVYSDYLVVDKYWVEYKEYSFASKTFAFIIAEERGHAADLKHELDIYMNIRQEYLELKDELKAKAERQFDEGYQEGKNDYAILVPCVRCGDPCILKPGTESHSLIVDVLREHKIVHNDCTPKYK